MYIIYRERSGCEGKGYKWDLWRIYTSLHSLTHNDAENADPEPEALSACPAWWKVRNRAADLEVPRARRF